MCFVFCLLFIPQYYDIGNSIIEAMIVTIILLVFEKKSGNKTRAIIWGIILTSTIDTFIVVNILASDDAVFPVLIFGNWYNEYIEAMVVALIITIASVGIFKTFFKTQNEVGFKKGAILGISIMISIMLLGVFIGMRY